MKNNKFINLSSIKLVFVILLVVYIAPAVTASNLKANSLPVGNEYKSKDQGSSIVQVWFFGLDSKKTDQQNLPSYSWEEIKAHNSPKDAWIVVDGNVYDISGFTKIHPGGNVFDLGHDNSDIYHSRHGNNKRRIERFMIGTVKTAGQA